MHYLVPQTYIARTHTCIAKTDRHKYIAKTQMYALLGPIDPHFQNPQTYIAKTHRHKCIARSQTYIAKTHRHKCIARSQIYIAKTHRHKCIARSHRHTLPEPTDLHCEDPQTQMHC